jgi:2-polyprenyl-6-methoxyphenol hydroxylase-like FAD-dependent oxidoreductase
MRDADGSVAMTEHAVVIAGGGPTGMMLAAELTLAGVDVAIVERRESAELVGSRAGGLHARTIEEAISAGSPIASSQRAR